MKGKVYIMDLHMTVYTDKGKSRVWKIHELPCTRAKSKAKCKIRHKLARTPGVGGTSSDLS